MTTTAPAAHGAEHDDERQTLDIEAMFPADPDLMGSPEGDTRGLEELQSTARHRRSVLAAASRTQP